MKTLMTLAIVSLIVLGLHAADVAGSWKGTLDTQMGATAVVITIRPGSPLAGKVQVGEFDVPIENPRLDGDKISFEANIEHGKLAFEGTVAPDEMKLNMTGTQGTRYSLVCKRQK
jgi:hypothetical protein